MQNNIDVVRGVYEALQRDDLDGLISRFADDCEIEMMGPSSIPFAGTYHGKQGVKEFVERYSRDVDILDFGPDEFHADDSFVTVLAHERGRSKQTGREWSIRLVDTYVVSDGKIRKFACAYDTASVAEALAGAAPSRAPEWADQPRA